MSVPTAHWVGLLCTRSTLKWEGLVQAHSSASAGFVVSHDMLGLPTPQEESEMNRQNTKLLLHKVPLKRPTQQDSHRFGQRGVTHRVRLECDPDIPVAPGEEHYVLDPSLDEDSLP